MRISIDPGLCSGHGRCFTLAPEVFASDDEGFSTIASETVASELTAAARRGAGACPEQAIRVEDD
jgi:ferredoxin